MVKRFDRDGERRIHFASAMTLLGKNDGASAADGSSYLDIVSLIRKYGATPKKDLLELWKRIVFNMAVSNTDDHLRNHGFILTDEGWCLSPLYDVNPNSDGDVLSLNVDEYNNLIDFELALDVAPTFGVTEKQAKAHMDEIKSTSAELVKAMFLSKDNNAGMDREKQEEISLQWDNIEKELHNDSLWAFLTNYNARSYQTRIDLVLNLIAKIPFDNKDKYFTFFRFDERRKSEDLSDVWKEIQHTFLILKDWYENHDLYHKIGYLIASRANSLGDIYQLSMGKKKSEFVSELDKLIKKSIDIDKNYAELSYDKTGESAKISRLLLLFNVESVRQIDAKAQRFPFDKYKDKASWSLEHIHAQQSEGMRRQEEWKEWLRLHVRSVKAVSDSGELISKMQDCIAKSKLERTEFESVQQEVIKALSVEGNAEYVHSISNLALLNSSDNAALNNSTFDVKRNEIIKMDKTGKYIPFCTKMVFLKYYTPSEDNQLHFWGQEDRIAYIQAINKVLYDYLPEDINIEKGGE